MAAGAAFLGCAVAVVYLSLIGSSQLLLFALSLCAAVALFEVAVVVTTRFRH
ncbi:hypothetical protein [Kribbella hippodromi]|uniref:hypothetical protein n=1 Tax=Kribbella hippodromi TaxID=434347 RepID=UPI0031CEF809